MRPDLDRLRAAQNGVMDLIGTRRRITKTNDGHGGFTESVAEINDIPCTLGGPSGESERIIASRLTDQAYWYLTVPVGTDIQSGDNWILGTRSYRVVYVANVGSFLTAVRCLVVDHG